MPRKSPIIEYLILMVVVVILSVVLYSVVWKPVLAQVEAVRTMLCDAANACEDQQ
jgi:type II secretory pathway component PulM